MYTNMHYRYMCQHGYTHVTSRGEVDLHDVVRQHCEVFLLVGHKEEHDHCFHALG